MASALPYTGRATQYPTYGQTAPTYGGPAVVYPMMPPGNYPPQHGQPYDTSAGKAQQQPFLPPQYPPTYPLQAIQQRHFGPNATHHPYGRANTYGYPTPGPAMPVHDPRYSAHGGYGVNYGIGKEHRMALKLTLTMSTPLTRNSSQSSSTRLGNDSRTRAILSPWTSSQTTTVRARVVGGQSSSDSHR